MAFPVINLEKITKNYYLTNQKPTLVETLIWQRGHTFTALNKISFKVKAGEAIGLIGKNGSGKTTLLEIISGITKPSSGVVSTHGHVVSLINLNAGFHPDLNGLENIYVNGLIIGMSRSFIRSQLNSIIKYAGLNQFIYAPLYTYSEGMKLRLGFSIAIHANPDIFLLDENISVGDGEFQNRSFETITGLIKQGKTLVFATHYLDFVAKYCHKAVWLDRGKIKKIGVANSVINKYQLHLDK